MRRRSSSGRMGTKSRKLFLIGATLALGMNLAVLAVDSPADATICVDEACYLPVVCDVVDCNDPPVDPPPPDHTDSCETDTMDAHWSTQNIGGVKVKARFRCAEAGVDQIQWTIILFFCPDRPHADEAGWESVDHCTQAATNTDKVDNPGSSWMDNNYHAMKYQPILDGWYVGCTISHYVQVAGKYRTGPIFTPSHHPALCSQTLQTCSSSEPYA